MRHPKDQSAAVTRRQLLRGAAAAAVGVGRRRRPRRRARTRPRRSASARTAATRTGAAGGGTEPRVEPGRRRSPSGRAACRCRATTTAWSGRSPSDNPPIADGLDLESGTLQLFNYADYIDPATSRGSRSSSTRKSRSARTTPRTRRSRSSRPARSTTTSSSASSGNVIVQLMAKQLLQPLNHSYLPNLANIWPQLAGSVLRPGRALHRPVRRVAGRDRLAKRQDRRGHRGDGRPVGHLLAVTGLAGQGRAPRRQARRAQHADAAGRDARRLRRRREHRGSRHIAKAGEDLQQLTDICNIKVTITDYQTLPEGKSWLHHSWSGDLLSAALYYLPPGTPPEVLSFWGPDSGGVVQNDFFCITAPPTAPSRPRVPNFMLDEKNAYDNMINFNGYIPPQNGITADSLIGSGLIPETLDRRRDRPEQFPVNQELLRSRSRASGSGTAPGRSSGPGSGPSMEGRWLWRLLALPGVLWLSLFFLVAFYAVVASRSGTRTRSTSSFPSGARPSGTSATSSRCSRTSGTAGSS